MPPQSWWHNPPGNNLTKGNLQVFLIPALLNTDIPRNTLIPRPTYIPCLLDLL